MAGLEGVITNDIIPLVEKAAPLLATSLLGPGGGLIVGLLGSIFHVDPKNVSALKDAITSDPEASVKLKTLEYQHTETLEQLNSTNYSTEVSDRINARATSVQYKDFIRHLAYLVTSGFFIALFLLFLPLNFSETDKQLLSMLVGMLSSKWQTIIDFFYGSSSKGV